MASRSASATNSSHNSNAMGVIGDEIGDELTQNQKICEDEGNNKKSKSMAWDYFTKIEKADGSTPTHARCNHCGNEQRCSSKNGTSTMVRHRCKNHPLTIVEKEQKSQRLISSMFTKKDNEMFSWKYDQPRYRKALAKMIVLDELPFSIVEHEGFKSFCQVLQPKFQLVSRKTITSDCLMIYIEERKRLYAELKLASRVCLTTDTWTSNQNLRYMCLTAHWIDIDWKIQKRIINFCVVPYPHTGDDIGLALESCLLGWNIERLCTIILDNASNNEGVQLSLKRCYLSKKDGLLLKGEQFHMRCCKHILNLIVKDGMDIIKNEISLIRSAISYIRSSPSRMQFFKKCCEKEKIVTDKFVSLDCPTRWNSTYLMLESAIPFQRAFERMEQEDRIFAYRDDRSGWGGAPTCSDWENAKILMKFLEIFYVATKRLSGTLYTTANIYFHELIGIEFHLQELEKDDPLWRNMAYKMKEKYNKYWGNIEKINLLLIVAVVLDPCYKLKYVEHCFEVLYGSSSSQLMTIEVKRVMYQLIDEYKLTAFDSIRVVSSNDGSKSSELRFTSYADYVKQRLKKKIKMEEDENAKSELDKYLDDPLCEDESEFDILQWWKLNKTKYPILALVARDVLAIPISTVASESAFSTSGRVLDRFRSSLSPKTVEALICTQDWLRDSKDSINVEEILEEVELLEKVIPEHIDDSGPSGDLSLQIS